jgi:murein L,D-transpeptidase YafK
MPVSPHATASLHLRVRSPLIRRWSSVLVTGLTVGCSSSPSIGVAANERKADRIVIVKSEHMMTLMANGKPLRSYRVALGKATGNKERQGDHKTPEGQYVIDQKNAQSRFHLALHISYPNASDRKRASDARADPGGSIMIHGVEKQFAWLGPLQHNVDWTDGCIAVTNREIDEIWRLVGVGTPVEIRP